ncbi:MAG TPA: phosphatidate cytidylyltransferase [Bryobacteraceae bacterium]|nr:phosphatidate cytidylyltransferase [Bryobacteraceae bacterium]
MKRVLTSAVLAPSVVWVVLGGPAWLLYAVIAAACVLCYREYAGIARAYGFGSLGPVGYGAGILLLASGDGLLVGVALVALAVALSMRAENLATALPRAALLVTGVFYVFGPFRCAILMHSVNPHWLMYGLLTSWIGDTAAFYVGRRWGRHKLARRVSPGKSWQGAVASVALAVVVGVLYMGRFLPGIAWWQAAALSAAVNAAGQVGDLAESTMKRGAGLKDSGNLLPGHGGLLDRVDSTLFALPAVYLYLRLTQL